MHLSSVRRRPSSESIHSSVGAEHPVADREVAGSSPAGWSNSEIGSQGVAQSGSAPGLEPGGRRFESYRPDHPASRCALRRISANRKAGCPPKPWRRRAEQIPTKGGSHATPRLRRTAVLSKPRASGGGGYASETQVRRGDRVVHGDKELIEKLGRNDLCPCGSGQRFQEMLPALRLLRRQRA